MEEGSTMSFLQHLEELRWRLVRSVVVILILAIVIWWNQTWIMDHIFISMSKPEFFTFDFFCHYLNFMCIEEIPVNFQSTTVGGQFSYALWMSILGGFVVGFPYVFYQLWSFVKPGLKDKEKEMVKGIVFYVSLLFFLGILFGYFVVAPMSVQFFGTYNISPEIQNNFTISSYMSTILSTVLYSGLFFLLPVVAYIMGKIGLISSGFLKKYRKHAIVGVLILSAIITPPDMVSQIIVSIPILALYEIGILVVKQVERKRAKE
ncbi:MAG: twin-arginine translocase subunit TatC [Fluviicola sp.]|nr:twin-arginine translocase subunit TatC [Fluviicola sp.]